MRSGLSSWIAVAVSFLVVGHGILAADWNAQAHLPEANMSEYEAHKELSELIDAYRDTSHAIREYVASAARLEVCLHGAMLDVTKPKHERLGNPRAGLNRCPSFPPFHCLPSCPWVGNYLKERN